jgi:hypothetical protein
LHGAAETDVSATFRRLFNRMLGMRNPLFKCWRDWFRRPSRARFVPTLPPYTDEPAEPPPAPKPHPMRRKTDKWPRV